MKDGFFVTTPIYYVNDVPHIGHAYTTIAADAVARFKRMMGIDVLFLTGTDEHGKKIEDTSKSLGKSPKDLVDEMVLKFKELWEILDISYDDFIRTTEKRHEKAVLSLYEKIKKKGDIYLGFYEGWYCVPCETFWSKSQLVSGMCPDCGRKPELVKEKSYFFKMRNYAQRVLSHIEKNPDFVQPTIRRNEVLGTLSQDLGDLSISRTTFNWGIPVPDDKNHVLYVWFDALINYLSGCGYPEDKEKFHKFWPADLHIIGKDILKFHAIFWPAFLMSADLPLPKRIFAHGWWTVEGKKMSKSFGNVVSPFEMSKKYGVDQFRYFLLREVPFGMDGDFSEASLSHRINSELVNDLGNLLKRTVTMARKYLGGVVNKVWDINSEENRVLEISKNLKKEFISHMDHLNFARALDALFELVRGLNRYVDRVAPWKLKKEGKKSRLEASLYFCLEGIRILGIYFSPFIPSSTDKIFSQIGFSEKPSFSDIDFGAFPGPFKVSVGENLFSRIT